MWFVASESDEADAGASKGVADEDDSEVEYKADYEAWEARTRKVMAAEKLLELTSGYEEAFLLLDTMEVVKHGKQGHNQVAKVPWCRRRLSQEGCGGIGRRMKVSRGKVPRELPGERYAKLSR